MWSLIPSVMAVQIPEYCRVLEESEISEHCFDLIFAFDEIVALGYRENVNLAQIRTFTEMDSHEEKVFRAVREVREREREREQGKQHCEICSRMQSADSAYLSCKQAISQIHESKSLLLLDNSLCAICLISTS